jgi:hypothetical protein
MDHQLKKVRVVGMQVHAEKIVVDTIQTQFKMLQENAEVYKSFHGEQGYNEMLISLVNKMMRSYKNTETTPSSVVAESQDSAMPLLEEDKE